MILEWFLIAVLHVETPDQEILVLERTPTQSHCEAKAQQYQEVAPSELVFGCIASAGPTQNTM